MPEVAGDPQQPAGDLVQPGGLDDALDQTAVELQHVDGEPAQCRDRGVAAAEAVQGDPYAESAQRDRGAAPARPSETRGSLSASSMTSEPGRQPVPGEQGLDRAERHATGPAAGGRAAGRDTGTHMAGRGAARRPARRPPPASSGPARGAVAVRRRPAGTRRA